MKRFYPIVYILIVSLTILLSGCRHERPMRIGVSQCSDDDWRRKMNEEIFREAMFHDNIEVEIRSADDSNERQIADLRYFVDNGFDIIVAAPNEAEALTPIIKEIYDSGIPWCSSTATYTATHSQHTKAPTMPKSGAAPPKKPCRMSVPAERCWK